MNRIIILAAAIIIFILSGFFIFQTIKNRDSGYKKTINLIRTETKNVSEDENSQNKTTEEYQNESSLPPELKNDRRSLLGISEADCENRCSRFARPEELKYCENICGLAPAAASSNCGDKAGSEKDYCLKNLAVSKKDFKICEEISDAGIKKVCNNRITEDIFEEQKTEL